MGEYRTVLVAEDEPDDAFLIGRALHDVGVLNPVQAVVDGAQAISYLTGEGKFADRSAYPFPGLFLLDLKMPKLDGLDVLRWLKQNPSVRQSLVVVVISSSLPARAIETAHNLGVDLLMEKPVRYADLQERMRLIKARWLNRDYLPAQAR